MDVNLFKEYLIREPNDSILTLERNERDSDFPIIGKGVQDLLRILIKSLKPKLILELGTGVGFSSILMASSEDSIKEITTIELKKKNINRALANIKSFGYENIINIIHGDACEVIKSKSLPHKEYDLVFIDFAKGQYPYIWEDIKSYVKPGGIVITDDIMQNNKLMSSRFLLNRRDRTIHKRMREFLYNQLNDDDFDGALFDIDDGVTVLTKK